VLQPIGVKALTQEELAEECGRPPLIKLYDEYADVFVEEKEEEIYDTLQRHMYDHWLYDDLAFSGYLCEKQMVFNNWFKAYDDSEDRMRDHEEVTTASSCSEYDYVTRYKGA
jgi:hypothetical protein